MSENWAFSSKINTLPKCVLTGWLRPFYLVIYWRERIGMLCSNCLSSLDITCNIKVIYACWTWVIIVKNYCKFCTKQGPLKLTILTVYSSVFFFSCYCLKKPEKTSFIMAGMTNILLCAFKDTLMALTFEWKFYSILFKNFIVFTHCCGQNYCIWNIFYKINLSKRAFNQHLSVFHQNVIWTYWVSFVFWCFF